MSMHVSDCIAMSEDGDWYAYSREYTRGEVMAATARQLDDIGYGDWAWTLKHYRVVKGYVMPIPAPDGSGARWHVECKATDPGALCVWLVRARGLTRP